MKTIEIVNADRNCGKCVACCTGAVNGEVNGHRFFKGQACFYLNDETGCSIYEDRPQHPCKDFNCEWITDVDNFPFWMRPDKSGVIFRQKESEGNLFLIMITVAGEVQSKMLHWGIHYAIKRKMIFVYFIEGVMHQLDYRK